MPFQVLLDQLKIGHGLLGAALACQHNPNGQIKVTKCGGNYRVSFPWDRHAMSCRGNAMLEEPRFCQGGIPFWPPNTHQPKKG